VGRRIVLAGIAAGVAVLTAGCGAGQIAQTAEEQPGVPGAQAAVGPIQLHNITVAYPNGGVYRVGSTARLNFVIANTGAKADQLVSVSSGSAKTVRLVPKPDMTAKTAATLTVGPQANLNVYGPGPKVLLAGIVRELRSSQQTTVTFRFAKAGQVQVSVPVAPASKALPKEAVTSAD
jgi:periplasmic copper chaperone A